MSNKELDLTLEKIEKLKKKHPNIQFNLGRPGAQTLMLILDRTK